MTTSDTTVHTRRPAPVPDGWTVAGAVVGLGCTLIGQFVRTPWKSGSDGWGLDLSGGGGWGGLAVLVVLIAIGLALVGFVTSRARGAAPERVARRSLVLAVLAVLALGVFWTGLPAILAGGAAGLSFAGRHSGRAPVAGTVALALAALVVLAAVYLAFTG